MLVGFAFASNALFNFLVGVLVARFLGPAEYGLFAIAWAGAVLLNTVGYDWIRLSAVRFYAERTRGGEPQVRATLDACFAGVTTLIGLGAFVLALAPLEMALSPGLLALAALTGAASGFFDYVTALARARFLDRTYVRIVLSKNILGLALTVGGALAFGSAKVALAGTCLSLGGSLAAAWRGMQDPGAGLAKAEMALARRFLAYGAPFIAASALLQLIPLGNRLFIGARFGLDEAGQFSLANDLGIRIFAAVASAMDVFLFQLAVRADDGAGGARRQLAQNMTLVLAAVAPLAIGFCLCLPSLEAVLAPPAYRGPFRAYSLVLAPGLASFVLLMYAVAPVFQIAKRTQPMVGAALAGCAVDAALAYALGPAQGGLGLAAAQSASLAVALLVALALAANARAQWPRARDLAGIVAGALAMALGVVALGGLSPGLGTLALQAAAGAAIYGVILWGFDVAGARGRLASLAFSNH